MKKSICLFSLLLVMTISVNAQLILNWNQKVSIGDEIEDFKPLLMVGYNCFFDETEDSSIGTAGTPYLLNRNNIGVSGNASGNNSFLTNDSYWGVIGKVRTENYTHGRSYGLCGMVDDEYINSSFYGGAGIYATNYDYYYSMPTNIQGVYAGYFKGNVYVSNNLTANSMFTTSDRRLSDNIVSLSKSKRSGMTTLDNLLNLDIVEYNLKGRLEEKIPDDVDPERAEELRKELEILKKEEQKMTSRRHFGIDARELQKVYPDLVLEAPDGFLSVNYLEMVPLVIRSIQELKEEIDELKESDEDYE
ncbi:MAG: tail fiber domain-containing protein [Paludibacteraceae bacterium]|nr:tail fiber domain-containing protein [Paludibacteraceae bacterium]